MSSDVRAYIAIIKVEKEAPNFVSTYYAKKEVGDGLLELKTIYFLVALSTDFIARSCCSERLCGCRAEKS